MREAHERPEGMEEVSVMMVGLEIERVKQALNILIDQEKIGSSSTRLVHDYSMPNVSEKVVKIIHSYTDYVNGSFGKNIESMSNNRKQRIVIISEIFYPEQTSTAHILTQISNHLASSYELLVLTASQNLKTIVFNKRISISENDIIRLRGSKFSQNNLITRILKLCILSLSFCIMTSNVFEETTSLLP